MTWPEGEENFGKRREGGEIERDMQRFTGSPDCVVYRSKRK